MQQNGSFLEWNANPLHEGEPLTPTTQTHPITPHHQETSSTSSISVPAILPTPTDSKSDNSPRLENTTNTNTNNNSATNSENNNNGNNSSIILTEKEESGGKGDDDDDGENEDSVTSNKYGAGGDDDEEDEVEEPELTPLKKKAALADDGHDDEGEHLEQHDEVGDLGDLPGLNLTKTNSTEKQSGSSKQQQQQQQQPHSSLSSLSHLLSRKPKSSVSSVGQESENSRNGKKHKRTKSNSISKSKKGEGGEAEFQEITEQQAQIFRHAFGHKLMTKHEYKMLRDSNSLDYHPTYSALAIKKQWDLQHQEHAAEKRVRWLVVFFIGITVGMVAFLFHQVIQRLTDVKLLAVYTQLESNPYIAWFIYVICNLGLLGIAAIITTYYQPVIAGGGIPEVKAYLNGIHVPKAFSLRTLFAKLVGTTMSVAASFTLGSEGSMIQCGALIGGWVSQALGVDKLISRFGLRTHFSKGSWVSGAFRNDRDRRDFISIGSACGVSAAFSAPLGGILFTSTEVSSFWSNELMWQTLFASMVAAFTKSFFETGVLASTGDSEFARWGLFDVSLTSLLNVGEFRPTYAIWELIPFILLGIFGGLTGALMVVLSLRVVQLRQKYIYNNKFKWKWVKVADVLIMGLIVSTINFMLPFLFKCRLQEPAPDATAAAGTYIFERFTCADGQYNPMASLSFARQDLILKHLFSRNTADWFEMPELIIYMAVFFLLIALTTYLPIPGGTILPLMIVGACYGRFLGLVILKIIPGAHVDPGIYALIGAASFFSGVTRMTISLMVIMMELTNDLNYLLPIIIIAMVAKIVGGTFTDPLYDELIRESRWPILSQKPPVELEVMTAGQVMTKHPVCIPVVAKVRDILHRLTSTTHHGFPVVFIPKSVAKQQEVRATTDDTTPRSGERNFFQPKRLTRHGRLYFPGQLGKREGRLCGMVSRKHLEVLLQSKVWTGAVKWTADSFQEACSRHSLGIKELKQMLTSKEDLQATIDLSFFMNRTPYSVHHDNSALLSYQLFMASGLRHLPVVDYDHIVVGIITRIDLIEPTLEAKYIELRKKTAEAPNDTLDFKSSEYSRGIDMLAALAEAELTSVMMPHHHEAGRDDFAMTMRAGGKATVPKKKLNLLGKRRKSLPTPDHEHPQPHHAHGGSFTNFMGWKGDNNKKENSKSKEESPSKLLPATRLTKEPKNKHLDLPDKNYKM